MANNLTSFAKRPRRKRKRNRDKLKRIWKSQLLELTLIKTLATILRKSRNKVLMVLKKIRKILAI